ncbi:MAG: hypothetical protein ACT4OZ_16975 [Gemmatimonadota bacterium]
MMLRTFARGCSRPARIMGASGAAILASVTLSCADFSIDPSVIASIEFPPLPSPSVIEGDTLRREDLTPYPLGIRVFTAGGAEVENPVVSFFIADTLTTVRGGFLVADAPLDFSAVNSFTSRIVASADGLQSAPRTIAVIPRPNTVSRVDTATTDTIRYSAPAAAGDTSMALRVRVSRTVGAVNVPSYLVRYLLVSMEGDSLTTTDTTAAFFIVADDGRVTPLDTTDASGQASRRLRFRIRQGQAAIDTVRVLARVRIPGQVPADVIWLVRVQPR